MSSRWGHVSEWLWGTVWGGRSDTEQLCHLESLQPAYKGFGYPGKKFALSSRKINLGKSQEVRGDREGGRGWERWQWAWQSSVTQALPPEAGPAFLRHPGGVASALDLGALGPEAPRALPPATFVAAMPHSLGRRGSHCLSKLVLSALNVAFPAPPQVPPRSVLGGWAVPWGL